MVRRYLRVYPFVAYLYKVNEIIPGGQAHTIKMKVNGSRDLEGVLHRCETHIRFTEEENEQGWLFLNEIGLHPSEKFVCIDVRDSAYKDKFQNWKNDWTYHNFRDSDIETYEEAALALAKKGYWVFRMGKAVNKSLMVNHPRILDYANTQHRSDFLDIWLMANCFFCVSTASGFSSVPVVFRKPIAFVNYIPIGMYNSCGENVMVPKKLLDKNTNQYLSFSEMLDHNFFHSENYKEAGIRIVDASPDEIKATVLEMEHRLTGSWDEKDEDNKLQRLFWQKFKAWSKFNKYRGWNHPEARLSAKFLRGNRSWFLAE